MKTLHVAALATALCLSSAFTSVGAQQRPPEQEEEHGRPQQPEERQEQDKPQPGQKSRQQPQSRPDSSRPQEAPESKQRPGNDRAGSDGRGDDNGRGSQNPSAQRPPSDFTEARRVIQQNRHSIGRGAAVANHVRIVKGERLPSGWGKRLNAEQLRPLPKYPGYEWRRLGSDMILVDVKTVIVVEILSGVLD